jgi:hypothetical protein
MKLYETESLSEKQRDKLTSYFKLAKKKIKNFKMVALVMIAYSEKKKDRLWVSLQANVIETLMWLTYLCSEQKIYSGYKMSENLAKDKRRRNMDKHV